MTSPIESALILVLVYLGTTVNASFFGLHNDTDYMEDEMDSFIPSHLCDYFSHESDLSDSPCSSDQLDSKGACNTTQVCQEDSHCYMSWRNISGVVTVVKSGCWLKSLDCIDKYECRAYNDSITVASGVYYCCCLGDFCSRNFYLVPAPELTLFEQDSIWEDEVEEDDPLIVLKILTPVLVLCVLTVIGFALYRKRKTRYDGLDRVSMETPVTVVSRCATVPVLLSSELPSPQLLDVKARGRFGKVWRAQLHDQIVAVKTFSLGEKTSWQNEQDIFCTPQMNMHPNVLKFLAASNRGDGMNSELWLITEFHERGSLADFLKVYTVNFEEALRIMKTMASGMAFLHEDIVSQTHEIKPAIAHRDFKSKNVLLDQDLNAVIADFGLAVKFKPGESPGENHGQVGTLRYMAPEILEGAINFQKDAFLRIDMYAFGLVMWEIMTRCPAAGEYGDFHVAFEEELGSNPPIHLMQEHVVDKKQRPVIKMEWKKHKEMSVIAETIDECWDHDAEARLPAGCVELRVSGIQRQRALTGNPTPLIVNMPPPATGAPAQGIFSDTETMNQRNLQMSAVKGGNNKHSMQQTDGPQITTLDGNQDQGLDKNNKTRKDLLVNICGEDDQDSGTFACEDNVSQGGDMEQSIGSLQTPSAVCVVDGDSDCATSLLNSEEQESNL